jgi:UDP-glucuronate 4-epimerase
MAEKITFSSFTRAMFTGAEDVLRDLHRFGRVRRRNGNGLDELIVEGDRHLQRIGAIGAHDLGDGGRRVQGVSGVLTLGAVGHVEIPTALHSAAFEQRDHQLARGARVGRRLQDDDLTAPQLRQDAAQSLLDVAQVRLAVPRQRRGDADQQGVGLARATEVGRGVEQAVAHPAREDLGRQVPDVGLAPTQHLGLLRIDVEPQHLEAGVVDGAGERQADVTKSDDSDRAFARPETGRQRRCGRNFAHQSETSPDRRLSSHGGPAPQRRAPSSGRFPSLASARCPRRPARLGSAGRARRRQRILSASMTYLVTGAAGFIGFSTSVRLLERGETVVGIDNLNDYYAVSLKRDRLERLSGHANFSFVQAELADLQALKQGLAGFKPRKVIHLAAQAGVRYSIENPHAYIQSNVVGHVNMLEYCRYLDSFEAMSYASSSSVYGGLTELPFSESQRVDTPISLYAATKKTDELIGHVYSHLYRMSLTGLRFFTVYGPWGRPDMAMWLFVKAILDGRPIQVFNHGKMSRDFTYIDDIVSGIVAVTDNPAPVGDTGVPHRVYNIGNNEPQDLLYMISVLEKAIGRTAEKEFLPMQPGDVPATYADISAIQNEHGYRPSTPIEVGIPAFVDWYKRYHSIA